MCLAKGRPFCSKEESELFTRLDKLRNTYKRLNAANDSLYAELDTLSEEFGCSRCDKYNSGTVNTITERYAGCNHCEHSPRIEEIAIELDQNDRELAKLVEGEFAEEIFKKYSRKNPIVIDTTNGHETRWDELFGNTFDKVSKSQCHALVRIYMKNGSYRIQ